MKAVKAIFAVVALSLALSVVGALLSPPEQASAASNVPCVYPKGVNVVDGVNTGAYMYGTAVEGQNLRGANLSGAYFSHAWLAELDMRNANLTCALLTGAWIFDTYLTGANLTGANLTGANLIGVRLWGANLTRANLSGARVASRARLNRVDSFKSNISIATDDPIRITQFDPAQIFQRLGRGSATNIKGTSHNLFGPEIGEDLFSKTTICPNGKKYGTSGANC